MSEYHADQEDTVLAYVRLKSGGERPFNRYGEGSGFTRQTPKTAKKNQPSAKIINLAEERTKRAKRLK